MNIPVACPKCNGPLVSTFHGKNDEYQFKACTTKADHSFKCTVSKDNDYVDSITFSLSMNPLVRVSWDFNKKDLKVAKGTIVDIVKSNEEPLTIPWFDPDLSDIRQLLNKIKTYVVFS